MTIRGLLLATCLASIASYASALEGELAGINYSVKSRVLLGLGIRAEDRDLNQVAKLSVPGQENLCNDGNNGCTTEQGNRDLIKAKGSFSGTNGDDGNWNYEKGEITDSSILFSPEIKLQRGDLKVEFSGLFYYDPVNADFTEFHADDLYQPAETKRADNVVDVYARRAELRKAYFQYTPEILGQSFNLKVGRQVLPWGESLLVLFNNLNQLNPLDANAAARPGFQLSDVSTPVNMAVLSFPIMDSLSLELVAPLEWRPVRAPPHGSFASTLDPVDNDYLTLGLGNQHEDPNRMSEPYGNNGLITSTSYSPRVLPAEFGYASDKGQYGGRLTYVADWLNGGTEISLHYLRYHSQFPYLSGYAANESCWHRSSGANGNLAFLDAALDCGGFANAPGGQDPLVVDTLKVFLEYPENIDLFGLSFNTNIAGVAVSGEYAYRPNMPLQILTTDVIFALLQPALPTMDLVATPGSPLMPGTVIPSGRNAVPDYLSQYRGFEVQGNQLIHGFERFPVHNLSMSMLKLFPHNPFGADDMTAILEVGATYIENMTGSQELPLNGPGENTHTSPGADGTGTTTGATDTRRQNPTIQTWNRPTELSYGYRAVTRLAYNTLIPGAVFEPSLIFFHDLKGITPAPQSNFIEGRKVANLGLLLRFPNELQLGAGYEAKFGSNVREYLERDRDRILLYGSYNF
ncbi:MAG: DUF1302 family protein [Pseudomonadota bacterium]